METVDVEEIYDPVEAEGVQPREDIQKVEPPSVPLVKAEEHSASETQAEENNERSASETRPASETHPATKGKRKSNTEKVRCDKCLREFNPAYLSRHICKPCVVSNEPGGKPGEEPTEPRPASETPPIPHHIVREATAVIPEDPPQRELTAADVAAFLRKQKLAQRAEKMAKYTAAMFGA